MPRKKGRLNPNIPTLNDVATLVGVSASTVSRVLNDNTSIVPISEETRQKILSAVQELGYQPNMIARSLRTQRTQMIAVMIGDITNAFYHPIVRAVQDLAIEHDYDVLISNSDHLYENEHRFLNAVLRRPVDGIIMAPHRLAIEDMEVFISRTQTPIVVLGSYLKHERIDVVAGNSELASYDAVSWLIRERHHTRIGFLGIIEDMPPGPARLRGYMRAMSEMRLPVEPGFVRTGQFTTQGGYESMAQLLSEPNPPTAVLAANSPMAVGASLAAREAGFRVPADIAVMGMDEIPEATIIQPQLTTIVRDLPAIGRQLAEMLFERINGGSGDGRFVKSEWTITEREST